MNRMTSFFIISSFPKAVVGDDGKRQRQQQYKNTPQRNPRTKPGAFISTK